MNNIEFNLTKDIQKANQAETLLNNELLIEVLDQMEKTSTESMINAQTPGAREEAWHSVTAVKRLRGQLEMTISNGKMSQKKLSDLKRREEAVTRVRGPK